MKIKHITIGQQFDVIERLQRGLWLLNSWPPETAHQKECKEALVEHIRKSLDILNKESSD